MEPNWTIKVGHVMDVLPSIPADSVHCIVTSPPYWGQRDYKVPPVVWGGDPAHEHQWDDSTAFCVCGAWCGQLGLEPTHELYIEHMVAVFRELRRVLRPDGTCWVNIGDCYHSGSRGNFMRPRVVNPTKISSVHAAAADFVRQPNRLPQNGLKDKDLVMIPARFALAMQADGWWLRSEIVWNKPQCTPENVGDRPTRSHEMVYLFARAKHYFYDAHAISEKASADSHARAGRARNPGHKHDDGRGWRSERADRWNARAEAIRAAGVNPKAQMADPGVKANTSFSEAVTGLVSRRNKRTVWTIPSASYQGDHYATFPPRLAEIPIRAGTSEAGACGGCGSQYTRILGEGTPTGERGSGNKQRRYGDGTRTRVNDHRGESIPLTPLDRPTLGWEPTCRCTPRTKVAPVVMDPFCGAGTTAIVAVAGGRRFVGIELGQSYADQARERIRSTLGLFAHGGDPA